MSRTSDLRDRVAARARGEQIALPGVGPGIPGKDTGKPKRDFLASRRCGLCPQPATGRVVLIAGSAVATIRLCHYHDQAYRSGHFSLINQLVDAFDARAA